MSEKLKFSDKIVWEPDQALIAESNLTAFMNRFGIESYDQLQIKSITDIEWFTNSIIKYLNIKFAKYYSKVIDLSKGIQFPQWCVDGKMNIVETCIDQWAENPKTENNIAFYWEGEEEKVIKINYKQLSKKVNKCANALRDLGIQKGDVVGIFMPMIPEIIYSFFAIAKVGAVILPLFSGYGADSVSQRLNDAKAKLLFTADGFYRRGNAVNMKAIVDDAVAKSHSIEKVIIVNRINIDLDLNNQRDLLWSGLVDKQSVYANSEIVDAEDKLMIIYTSGTTGKPKGVVHTHCGFPIKAAQDMAFGTEIHTEDVIYWMTDMGWMMGPWLVFGASILGATFLIYDGAHDFPDQYRMWDLIEKYKVKTAGVSPTLIRVLMKTDLMKIKSRDLSALRFFASTSEPWNYDPWMWLFKDVGDTKRPIINYSGGTEISGGILMGNPLTPLKPASFSDSCLGIAADVFDKDGNPVVDEVGELVIKAPWIGMTRSFLNDDEKYIDSYYSRWDNIWVHGDWALKDNDGAWYILGRSDETIKVAGKRVGPAEIESSLVNHTLVEEAAVIGVPHKLKGNVIVCFCKLIDENPSEELKNELKNKVAREQGKPLKPAEIFFVSDIPKTRNGKIMRRIIKKAFMKESLGDITGLQNPEAVNEINKIEIDVNE